MNSVQLETLKKQAEVHNDKEILWLIEQAEKVETIKESIKGKWTTESISVNELNRMLKDKNTK